MKKNIRNIYLRITVALGAAILSSPAGSDVEIRTLQAWNLPHPFQGPKSLTENVFSHLMHPTLREYVNRNDLSIQYSREDDCLIVQGDAGHLGTIESSLAQLPVYRHPQSSFFVPETGSLVDKKVLRFPRVCTKDRSANPKRVTLEYQPVVPQEWSKLVRYGLNYSTLGSYKFPQTVTTGKDREIKGEIKFLPKSSDKSAIHALSYRGMSKEDLREKLHRGSDETRIYIDVPYKKLLQQGGTGDKWALYKTGIKALKVLCPNYNNERIRHLFLNKDYRSILQKMADFVYQKRGVGIMDTGLQPVHRFNVLEFNTSRPLAKQMVDKTKRQLINEWKAWLTSQRKNSSVGFQDLFYIDGDRLLDVDTDELVAVRVFFADIINDQAYFGNLKSLLEDSGMLELQINRRDDFITVDRFRPILEGRGNLKNGHEGIIFDIPVPYNDHIEHYFAVDRNFFGLDATIAPKVIQQVQSMQSGDWAVNTTKRLGRLLREESPCLVVGQHPFYTYTRKTGKFQLPGKPESDDAPTAYRIGNRIKQSALR